MKSHKVIMKWNNNSAFQETQDALQRIYINKNINK